MAVVGQSSTPHHARRPVFFWIVLLLLAQVADLITTQIDMAQGGIEANLIAAQVMALGGIGLLMVVKISLVIAMALAVILIDRHGRRDDDRTEVIAHTLVWRGVQVCVLVLAVTALHNAVVLIQLQS